MAGLIEFSHDVIWYSADGPYREVLRAAAAYLDDAEVLDTHELLIPAIAEPQAVLRALDHAVVRLMAELVNAAPTAARDAQLDHYAELRSMVRAERALSPEPPA